MEMPMRGALPVVEEDEGCGAPPGSEERLRYRRRGGGRRRGLPFNRAGHYLLIVVGEIGTEQQLRAARAQVERGECGRVSVRVAGCCPDSACGEPPDTAEKCC
ncbi:putative microtubule-associated protein 1B-like [Scophthalmus maximus]|uniref:Putative microtubule-associated protein 1B-like n=1 Tax=Scophthalmus maximus TaxID=52904 RepID=A0A2U9BV79_SCOMX|nr:putative microtubule-associated protein 1B-like [Scophthalmus maximus]KAF0040540.1 hypothetical protein F2P81_006438 [Scophthalmus maximus]